MRKLRVFIGYLLLILCAITMILPFLWLVLTSFMGNSQIFSSKISFIPNPFITANYTDIFQQISLSTYFMNSLIVALITTIGQVFISAMAGYAFARFNFKFKNALFIIVLITMMVPPQVNIIPLFFMMKQFNWLDTYYALIVPGFFGGFGVFMMRQWFIGFSKEIEESAKIDGCSVFGTFFKIALPLALPILTTLAVFTFVSAWNSFMWPLIVTNSDQMKTLTVAIASFKGSFREITMWGQLMACSVISVIPVILIFLVGKKYFINDVLAGSLKE